MKSKKVNNKKSAAQAMVEFAIALPILLALAYGLLETGRFLFLYSTVVTASRQAVRYGAGTGIGTGTAHRYWDCDGIRQAANNAGYLGDFDTITIANDDGPGTLATEYCLSLVPIDETSFIPSTLNTDRLVVTVTEQFTPIVPNLVPFVTRNITATSARTILVSVNIIVTAPAGGGGPGGGGAISLEIISPGTYTGIQTINFTYRVTNTSTTDTIDTSTLSINTDKGSAVCSSPPATLSPGASFDCTGTYTTLQADVDTGNFTNTATANAGALSDADIETLTATQSPALTLDKTSTVDASAVVGFVIPYTYTLTNSGNVTLKSPYAVSDNKVNSVSCPSTGDLAPGASTTCTGSYTLKNSDINAGTLVNIATGTAIFDHPSSGPQTITSNSDSWTVYTPALYLTVSASTPSVNAVGQVINYIYTLRNNTNSNLREPYTVSDSRVTNENCPGIPATLGPGSSVQCTGSYPVTQANLNAGTALGSTITATARKATGNATESSNTETISVGVTQTPVLNLQVTVLPTTATVLNTVITYTYTLTNTGNVTLSPAFTITDDKASSITCTNPAVAIAPGGTKTCTGTRTISQPDLDAGSVTNQATASATLGASTITSNTVSTTVATYIGPRLTLVITSNPPAGVGAGQILTFTYTLNNTGSVPLALPYTVSSNIAGAGDCTAASATLPVAGSTACIGFYTTTATDVVNGSVTNLATATGMDGAAPVTSNNAFVTVPVTP